MSGSSLGLLLSVLFVNTVHTLFYLKPRKNLPAVLAGLFLLALPWLIVNGLTGTPSSLIYGRPFVMIAYLLYCSWIFSRLIMTTSVKQAVFTVFFIVSFMQITFLAIYLVAVHVLGYPPTETTHFACRYLYCLASLLLFPLIYIYFRPIFIRILDSVELQKLYLVAGFQICIFLLGYATSTMAFFHQGDYVAFAACSTILAEVTFYFVLYSFITRESENQILQNQIAASGAAC